MQCPRLHCFQNCGNCQEGQHNRCVLDQSECPHLKPSLPHDLGGGFQGSVEGVLPSQEAGEEAAQDLVELVLGQDLLSAGKDNNIAQAKFIFCFKPTTTWLCLLYNTTVPKYGGVNIPGKIGLCGCKPPTSRYRGFLPVFLVSRVATDGAKYLATALCSETGRSNKHSAHKEIYFVSNLILEDVVPGFLSREDGVGTQFTTQTTLSVQIHNQEYSAVLKPQASTSRAARPRISSAPFWPTGNDRSACTDRLVTEQYFSQDAKNLSVCFNNLRRQQN